MSAIETNGATIEPSSPTESGAASSGQQANAECSHPPTTTSTGPRTRQGKMRSSANASKHKILVGRILPEEAELAALISEELLKDLNPQRLLEREIVYDIAINRLQRRRIDRYNVYSVVIERVQRVQTLVEMKEQSRAEQFLRQTDSQRANSPDSKRLIPEACVEVLSGLRAQVEDRGPLPKEDIQALKWVYGQEPTALGAMSLFLYRVLECKRFQPHEMDEKSKVEYEQLREEILEALKNEIEFQQRLVKLKLNITKAGSLSNVPVPSSTVEDRIQRYYSANAREFAHLLDALERVRRLLSA